MDSMINLTVNGVLADLDALVSEFGEDYVYSNASPVEQGPTCVYATSRRGVAAPSCIAGHVLVRNGFPIDELVYSNEYTGRFSVGTINENLQTMKEQGLIDFEEGVSAVLREAQIHQDTDRPWGYAVDEARNVVGR